MAIIAGIHPTQAVPGGRVLIVGSDLPLHDGRPPRVRIGEEDAHVVSASREQLRIVIPPTAEGGSSAIQIDGVAGTAATIEVARVLSRGLHQVDSPAFDGLGRLYVTQSGGPGTKVSVPIYRVSSDGVREPVAIEIANPTSLTLGPDGAMYVSSRFEGTVYRLTTDDQVETYATELGVPTGLAFSADGWLYVGDRSGTIFRISPTRQVETFATLPASVAAFHLAFGPDDCLYVTAPTLASHDLVYRITPDRLVDTACDGFGRPQGLAFDNAGQLYVADALAGAAGLYRLDFSDPPASSTLIVSAPALIGVAFDPDGGVVLASNDVIWRLDVDLKPYWPLRVR